MAVEGEPTLTPQASSAAAEAPVKMPASLAPPNQRPLAEGTTAITRVFDDYGFPPHPGLDHYCAHRLLEPDGTKITLDAFSSRFTRQQLADYYEQRLSQRGMQKLKSEVSWQLPAGSAAPERALTIVEPSVQGRHQACEQSPAPGAASSLVLTRFD